MEVTSMPTTNIELDTWYKLGNNYFRKDPYGVGWIEVKTNELNKINSNGSTAADRGIED